MRARTAFLIALLTPAVGLGAQGAPGTGSAVGTVYDSVRIRPLAKARVRVDSTSLTGVTDENGLFRIDSIPPGEHFLRVEHPMVDTLGIALRTAPFTVHAGETKLTELATPSAETMLTKFCSAAWRGRGPGALMGRVLDAESGTPAVGAKVSLVWFEIESAERLRKAARVREAVVGPDGVYRICGLPAGLDGKVQVIRGKLTSGEVPINFGEENLALRSMSIADLSAVVVEAAPPATDTGKTAARAPAPPRIYGSARLTGRVLNKLKQPVVGARVQLEGTLRAVDTRANGEFTLDSLPPGTQTVSVRKLGFAPVENAVDLASRDTRSVTIQLDDFVPVLETVRVNAQRDRALQDVGFSRRKQVGNGWYMDGQELEAHKQSLNFSDVLRSAPGILIQRGAGDRQFITSSRDPVSGCVNVWIDGTQWNQLEPGDVDDFVKPYELVAIEVYSPTTTPSEFQGMRKGNCSTVIAWTQRRIDRLKK